MDPTDPINAAIGAAAAGPANVTVDGVTVSARPVAEMIAAAQHVGNEAVRKNRRLGIRFLKILPPGTIGTPAANSRAGGGYGSGGAFDDGTFSNIGG